MTNINWDIDFFFNPQDPANPFPTSGIPIPTYGNYGGADYSAGKIGGTTPEPSALTPKPVDQLDGLFYLHDLAYQHVHDGVAPPSSIPYADAALIAGMGDLKYTDPGSRYYDPEAGLYEGVAVFGITLKLETELAGAGTNLKSFLTTLPHQEQADFIHAIFEAPVNVAAGLEHLPRGEVGEATSLLSALHLPLHSAQNFLHV
jgi:hypothetical protein